MFWRPASEKLKLDNLPTELLLLIAKDAQINDADDLRGLTLANKTLSKVAQEVASHTLRISVKNDIHLAQQATARLARLIQHDNRPHVRTLILKGMRDHVCLTGGRLARQDKVDLDRPSDLDSDPEVSEGRMATDVWPSRFVMPPMVRQDIKCPASQILHRKDGGFAALATLVACLPRLETVYAACAHQIPRQVLEAILLPRKSPCRVDVHNFALGFNIANLLTLPQPVCQELQLLTCPALRNVGLIEEQRPRNFPNARRYSYSVTMQLLLAYSPALQSVTVAYAAHQAKRTPTFWVPQLTTENWPSRMPGSLKSLKFVSSSSSTKPAIASELWLWKRLTMWQALEELVLSDPLQPSHYQELTSTSFPALRKLIFYCEWKDPRWSPLQQGQQALALAGNWLRQRMSGLTHLTIRGALGDQLLASIMETHGSSLVQLHLRAESSISSALTVELSRELVELCPSLEDLAIPVGRRWDDAKEANVYQMLARIRRLRKLVIYLDILPYAQHLLTASDSSALEFTWNDLGFLSEDRQILQSVHISNWNFTIYEGDLHHLIHNAAIDEATAGDIYTCLIQHRPAEAVPLESIELSVRLNQHREIVDTLWPASKVLHDVHQSWILRRVGHGFVLRWACGWPGPCLHGPKPIVQPTRRVLDICKRVQRTGVQQGRRPRWAGAWAWKPGYSGRLQVDTGNVDHRADAISGV